MSPLPGIIRSGTPQEVEDCISLNEGMLAMLENSAPKTVVLVKFCLLRWTTMAPKMALPTKLWQNCPDWLTFQ